MFPGSTNLLLTSKAEITNDHKQRDTPPFCVCMSVLFNTSSASMYASAPCCSNSHHKEFMNIARRGQGHESTQLGFPSRQEPRFYRWSGSPDELVHYDPLTRGCAVHTPASISSSDTFIQSSHVVLPIRLSCWGRSRGSSIVQREHAPAAQACPGVQGVLQHDDMRDHGMLLTDEGRTAHKQSPTNGQQHSKQQPAQVVRLHCLHM